MLLLPPDRQHLHRPHEKLESCEELKPYKELEKESSVSN